MSPSTVLTAKAYHFIMPLHYATSLGLSGT